MNFETIRLAFFSPTGTTKAILNAIAEGYGAKIVEQIDLTLPGSDTQKSNEKLQGLTIIGVPVYEGRVAATAISRLEPLKAQNTPAIVIVMYGNRDYEDALLELSDWAKERGFLPVAGGAFIGEHSFSTEDKPLAGGRPDGQDIAVAKEFGLKVRDKLSSLDKIDETALIKPPGNTPYISHDRSGMEHIAASTIVEDCTLCGECESLCPVGSITVKETVKTDNAACILCCACIKNCPEGARAIQNPMVDKIWSWVQKNFQARKEPEVFV